MSGQHIWFYFNWIGQGKLHLFRQASFLCTRFWFSGRKIIRLFYFANIFKLNLAHFMFYTIFILLLIFEEINIFNRLKDFILQFWTYFLFSVLLNLYKISFYYSATKNNKLSTTQTFKVCSTAINTVPTSSDATQPTFFTRRSLCNLKHFKYNQIENNWKHIGSLVQ